MTKIFFTSDLHFGHDNITKFEPQRADKLKVAAWTPTYPHDEVLKHDDALIARINSRVRPEDTLYILGDVCLAGTGYAQHCISRLNGKKILIRGNHDKHTDSHYHRMGFYAVCHEMVLKISGQFVRLSHYPYRKPWWKAYFPWQWKEKDRHKRPINHDGRWLLHGHIHSGGHGIGDGSHLQRGKQINVGVDVWDYYPVPLEKIGQMIQRSENAESNRPQLG